MTFTQALAESRRLLNDVTGAYFTDAVLTPHITLAWDDLFTELVSVNAPVLDAISVQNIPALTSTINLNFFTVQSVYATVAGPVQDWKPVTEVFGFPTEAITTVIQEYKVSGSTLIVNLASVNQVVTIHYQQKLPAISSLGAEILVPLGHIWLIPQTALRAANSTGALPDMLTQLRGIRDEAWAKLLTSFKGLERPPLKP